MAGPMAEVEKAVKRPHWEPRHEWESRIKFVEDNMGDHGLEKAVTLSIVWANMKFLGCSYPSGTEKLVSSYPVPELEELKARRRAKEALKRGMSGDDSPTSPKRAKVDDTVTAADVSSLISSIRSQSEGGGYIPQYDEKLSKQVPRIVQTIASAVCTCKECIGKNDIGAADRLTSMLQMYATSKNDSFNFEFKEDSTADGGSGYRCTLIINGELIAEKITTNKEECKSAVSVEVLKMADNWQEAHGKPSCPKLAAQYAKSQPQYTEEYNGSSGTPSRYTGYNREAGSSYNQQQRGRHYNHQSPDKQRSRYSSEYFMPPPARPPSGGRGDQGYYSGGRGYSGGGRGYQHGSPRYQ